MTKHYQGNEIYNCYFTSGKLVVLTTAEIAELQEEQAEYVDELENEVTNMNSKAYKFSKELDEISSNLDKIVSEEEIKMEDFNYEQTKISELINKLEDI